MRIIAGKTRGLKLVSPRGMATRPTSDRVKEALFSILESQARVAGASVLDICAGCGSLGLEALSRGADSCIFIEKERHALEALHRNLGQAGFSRQSGEVIAMDCMQALSLLHRRQARFSLVLFDPPYRDDLYARVIPLVGKWLLMPEGLLVAEAAARWPLPEQLLPCIRNDRRIYGDTALEFYTLEPHHAP